MTLDVVKYPVGLDTRVEDISTLMRSDTEGVTRIGIHGMGGVGKITLAKAVYNRYYFRFQGSCFLENVMEASGITKGLVSLQPKLVNDFLKCRNINIDNVDQGIELLRARICSIKILIVIDDLDNSMPLDFLVGPFASGSILIITTRNDDLLDALKVEARYKVNELDKHGACQKALGHPGGGPSLDTCKQSTQARRPLLPRSNNPDLKIPNQQLHLIYAQKIQGRRQTEPPAHRSYHLALEGGALYPWVSVPLDSPSSANSQESPHLKPIHICSLKSWSVVCTIVVMARPGKNTAGRPSASTHIQEQDPSQDQEPRGDRETLQEQPLTQHTPVRDARNVIELNQYKYTNVPVAEEHMANLTRHELAEAIRLYRDEQARLQIEYEQDESKKSPGILSNPGDLSLTESELRQKRIKRNLVRRR
ncbi:hypothetical protein AgCh_039872 [Apium graveolens]